MSVLSPLLTLRKNVEALTSTNNYSESGAKFIAGDFTLIVPAMLSHPMLTGVIPAIISIRPTLLGEM